ncbi:hypothetical protein G7Y89_g5764 [Cudoniella acicularis]|uniref:AB hydrolase-1 domain-containing protein n=1 Tax=Cudoniella acicularis TaxID=354080 RepID=A0A8H4W5F4_9HELO|nr:hypothetical protein G7Y89_g5764 [Cudoniella acicularis]
MPLEDQTFLLEDGRTMAWCEYGDPSSPYPPIFYFHSFPSGGCEGAMIHEGALAKNLRIISPDRPGYGLSTLQPTRTFLSYTSDILALVDHLRIPQFKLLSVSGGCPYLLACLKALPRDRCLGGQSISGIYPLSLGTQGMAFMQRSIMFIAYYSPSFVGTLMNMQLGAAARDPDPQKLKDVFLAQTKSLPEKDRIAMESEHYGGYGAKGLRAALRNDGRGAGVEAGLYATEWGFKLQDIDGKGLRIWHGKHDTACPLSMAEKAAALIPGVDTSFLQDDGHSIIAYHLDAILANFLPATK